MDEGIDDFQKFGEVYQD